MVKTNFICITCILFLSAINAVAQTRKLCSTNLYYDSTVEKRIVSYLGTARTQQTSDVLIPVAIHILYNSESDNFSDQQILDELQELNNAYNNPYPANENIPDEFRDRAANVRISFCLAGKSPDGTPSNGIIRKLTTKQNIGQDPALFYDENGGSTAWDPDHVFNIWVAPMDKAVLGFSSSPWDTLPARDGVVINTRYFGKNSISQYNLGKTLVHETGHYFGLYHPWRDDEDCSTDDEVADTPPQEYPYYGCPSYPQYSCGASNMFMNYMDYVDDQCMLLFTKGQADRMHACLNIYRSSLLENHVMTCYIASERNIPAFDLYPNPARDQITIQFSYSDFTEYQYYIYDAVGRLMLHGSQLGRTEDTIDISSLPPGMYIVKVGDACKKLIRL